MTPIRLIYIRIIEFVLLWMIAAAALDVIGEADYKTFTYWWCVATMAASLTGIIVIVFDVYERLWAIEDNQGERQ